MRNILRFQKQEIPGFAEYHRLLDSLEPRIFKAFTDALSSVEIEYALIRDLFEQGNIGAILRTISSGDFERAFANLVTPELEEIAARGQLLEAARLRREVSIPDVDWQVLSEDVLVAMRTQSARLVTGISAESRIAVRRFLADAYEQGRSSRTVASQIADVAGLTERQAVAVGNFSQALDDAFAGDISEAALRRRYKLSPRVRGRKETILREYTRRQLRHRGERIARTETITAFTQGRHAAWQRMRETGAMPREAVQEWLTSPDERSCQICIPLHGEQAPVGGSFAGGFAGPPAHVMCRCDTRVVLNPENVHRSAEREEADRFLEARQHEGWRTSLAEEFDPTRVQDHEGRRDAVHGFRASFAREFGDNPDAMAYLSGVDRWIMGSQQSELLDDMQRVLAGASGHDDARALLRAISQAPADAPTLYRGIWSGDPMDRVIARYQRGAVLDLRASSFTTEQGIASKFAGWGVDEVSNPVEIIFHLERGAKATKIENLSFHWDEREWITGGRFEVTTIGIADGKLKIGLRQLGVFDVE